jgi:hypothetical protein
MLSQVNLGIDTPALDPLVFDCINCDNLPEKVLQAYDYIIHRLNYAGMNESPKIVFVAMPEIIEQFPRSYAIELCVDKHVATTAYLLTLSSGGQVFIKPPFEMSWDDYFLSITYGHFKPLRVLAPWAQAKFINVKGIIE